MANRPLRGLLSSLIQLQSHKTPLSPSSFPSFRSSSSFPSFSSFPSSSSFPLSFFFLRSLSSSSASKIDSNSSSTSFADTIGLVPKRLRADQGNLPFSLRDRTRPASPSFYTGLQNSTYNDFILLLQRKVASMKQRHSETSPDDFHITPENFPTWITKEDLQNRLQCRLRTTQYRSIVSKLNEIYAQPNAAEESEFLAKFRRSVEVKEKQAKQRELDQWGRMYALGRRKNSIAQIYLSEGTGEILVNGKQLYDHFSEFRHRESVISPLFLLNKLDCFNVWIKTEGGGPTGQSEAIKLGLSRALEYWDPNNCPSLRQAGYLTRDPRTVEPKKPGRKKARKLKQWVKR